MPKHEERIQLSDTMLDVFHKLSGGNPGALKVLTDIATHGRSIDPDCEPPMILLSFDAMGIYGADIWMLFADVCGENLAMTIGMVRARQLGIVPIEGIRRAIATRNRDRPIDLDAVRAKVKGRLPRFDFDFDPREGRPRPGPETPGAVAEGPDEAPGRPGEADGRVSVELPADPGR